MIVQIEYIDNALRPRRPGIPQSMIDLIIKTITCNSTTRGWLCARIRQEIYNTLGITPNEVLSISTIVWTLKKQGYGVYKRTVKPGLNKKQKDARYAWCLLYKDWTLED